MNKGGTMKDDATHMMIVNADGSSHVRPLRNTPDVASGCDREKKGEGRSLREAHAEIVATLEEIRQVERRERFGFVRSVLTGEDGESVLDD